MNILLKCFSVLGKDLNIYLESVCPWNSPLSIQEIVNDSDMAMLPCTGGPLRVTGREAWVGGVAGTSSFHSVTPQKPGFPCLLGNQKITRASSTSFLLRNFNTSMLIFWSVVRSHFENGCSIIIIKKAVILCWVIYCKIIYKYLAVFSNLNNGPTNSSDKDSSKLKTKSACWILLYLKNKSIQQIKIKQFFFWKLKKTNIPG